MAGLTAKSNRIACVVALLLVLQGGNYSAFAINDPVSKPAKKTRPTRRNELKNETAVFQKSCTWREYADTALRNGDPFDPYMGIALKRAILSSTNAAPDAIHRIACMHKFALVMAKQAQYREAEFVLKKCIELGKNSVWKASKHLANCYYDLGRVEIEINNFLSSEQNLSKALELYKEIKPQNQRDVADTLFSRGECRAYLAQQEYNQTKARDTAKIASAIQDFRLAGDLYDQLDAISKKHPKTLYITDAPSDNFCAGRAFYNAAVLAAQIGDDNRADSFLTKSLACYRRDPGPPPFFLSRLYLELGLMLYAHNDFGRAAKAAKDGLAVLCLDPERTSDDVFLKLASPESRITASGSKLSNSQKCRACFLGATESLKYDPTQEPIISDEPVPQPFSAVFPYRLDFSSLQKVPDNLPQRKSLEPVFETTSMSRLRFIRVNGLARDFAARTVPMLIGKDNSSLLERKTIRSRDSFVCYEDLPNEIEHDLLAPGVSAGDEPPQVVRTHTITGSQTDTVDPWQPPILTGAKGNAKPEKFEIYENVQWIGNGSDSCLIDALFRRQNLMTDSLPAMHNANTTMLLKLYQDCLLKVAGPTAALSAERLLKYYASVIPIVQHTVNGSRVSHDKCVLTDTSESAKVTAPENSTNYTAPKSSTRSSSEDFSAQIWNKLSPVASPRKDGAAVENVFRTKIYDPLFGDLSRPEIKSAVQLTDPLETLPPVLDIPLASE
jgi:tetratricopeptide (TPR) repeat protein